ncbi:acyl-CoA dehydrogenase family protein [Congregibacter litoralis]|uniref:Acyl-CoA dehydrogenase n=1 Tax=Congregibacter litoralis KT71 TaxID=314285 RepID=A4A814_9GAMM|nr:acyl-CoA dehydrogenase family protein [Congregibacter litoralis]EAQ97809.2 Acyl-CoA dehydrogenase [Congregibacter litoralis KT71]
MAQPKNYGFEEEAGMLKDGARRFFAEKLPVDQLHALVADAYVPERAPEVKWRKELWDEMVALGWTSLAVPESAGGVGMPWVAVAALLEENGRAAFPSPLLTTLQATAVLSHCGQAGEAALAEVAGGCAATIAVMDPAGSAVPGAVKVVDGKLMGTASFVQDAGKCDSVLVVATDEGEPTLFWVKLASDGVEVRQDAIIDLTRDQARVSFDGVAADRIETHGAAAWDAALPTLWMLLSADMVGAAEWLLQTTVEYAQQRKQFDRSLGFFQAVKHDLVNVMIAIDESKSLLYSAACAIDHEPERARELAHMAKSSASDTAAFAAGRTVQMHGGIGFTWECYVHLYFKRQKHSQLLWGDAAWHRAALAALLLDGPSAAAAA